MLIFEQSGKATKSVSNLKTPTVSMQSTHVRTHKQNSKWVWVQTELQDCDAATAVIISHTLVYVLLLILLKPGLIQRLKFIAITHLVRAKT